MTRPLPEVVAELRNALVPLTVLPDAAWAFFTKPNDATGHQLIGAQTDASAAIPRVQALLDELGAQATEETSTILRDVAHALGICYEADGHACEPGDRDSLLARVAELDELESAGIDARLPSALSTWHEDDGPALWWRFPVTEPPYSGSPLDDDFPDYVTHWTRIPLPIEPEPGT